MTVVPRRCTPATVLFVLLSLSAVGRVLAQSEEYLGDNTLSVALKHEQQWGDFGLNTAAAATGNTGTPLQIGDRTFERGLGHHANGEIVVDLRGQFIEFRSLIGVQWQGGSKGSVTFQVAVDGEVVFKSEPMSDSDAAREVQVPLRNARELRLIATDSGDGIGCDMANWVEARLVRDPSLPSFGAVTTSFAGQPAPALSADAAGFSLLAAEAGPQVAVMESARMCTVGLRPEEDVRFVIPVQNVSQPLRVVADIALVYGEAAEVELSIGDKRVTRRVNKGDSITLETESSSADKATTITLTTRGTAGEAGVRWQQLRCASQEQSFNIPLTFPREAEQFPPRSLPTMRPSIEQELVEWDWRMQDGIGTARESRSWQQATQEVLQRGDQLIQDLTTTGVSRSSFNGKPQATARHETTDAFGLPLNKSRVAGQSITTAGVSLEELTTSWQELHNEFNALSTADQQPDGHAEDLWRRVHQLRRRIAFANPLADVGPLLFAKQVPGCFSHQLTQYFGMCARPGGGIFVLDAPGKSMQCRQLGELPSGSYQHPEVSWDGQRVLFAFCETDSAPTDRGAHQDRKYQLYEMATDGSGLRRVTDGPYDDFSPRYLPDGKILFLSTRRGGYHRCGAGPCPVYTMAIANADGSDPRVISFHETHEWDPAVLNDGRIVYTRWDYVDRNAVHYQHLWSARPDGSDVRAFYGNNTFNPVGIWEARPVPNSHLVMATAGAHHAMTAGSIILVDVARGIDGLEPISRLTPDALFPESESRVERWHSPVGVSSPPTVSAAELRWPGHCYRTPYPLSETYFLAAYSFDPLLGEPFANHTNMFGLYLVDRFGNKELIYRDANIGSLWPTPLRARQTPPALASNLDETTPGEGTFFVQNVYESWPKLPSDETIKSLRILQVLPKTTPHANNPRVGLANASPGKQVLGTVPVESDGSAYFRAPASVPLSFQALDERGMAVQTMRSLTYLQPGEHASCIGCHEYRNRVPAARISPMAKNRLPSVIAEGPDGAKPLSYPILVQPVLDKHCVTCHSGSKPDGGLVLTGTPAGSFTASYNALAPLVAFSQWQGSPAANFEPLTRPDRFGARASKLMTMLLKGHEGVELSEEDIERLATWMDANALFYGTFDVDDQKRQQKGERIAGPALE